MEKKDNQEKIKEDNATKGCKHCPKLSKKTKDELKDVTLEQFMFCDFNNNGLVNVDDPRPFDPYSPNPPVLLRGHFHHAQFYGGEVRLSDELLALRAHNESFVPQLMSFIKENPKAEGRIKTVPSTMKKLRERYIFQIGDIAGVRLLSKDYHSVQENVRRIKRRYPTISLYEDNYYKRPKSGFYFAHHLSIKGKDYTKERPRRMEVQLTTQRQAALQARMHPWYKRGIENIPSNKKRQFTKEALKLRKLDMRKFF